MNALRTMRQIYREAEEVHPGQGGALAAKALWARARYGFALQDVFIYDLPTRPRATWPDYVPYWREFYDTLQVLNRWPDAGLRRDKHRQTDILARAEVPVIPTLALFARDPRWGAAERSIDRSEDAAAHFAALADGRYVLKEIDAGGGRGTLSLDAQGGRLSLEDRAMLAEELGDFVRTSNSNKGWLLQPRLATHAGLSGVGGENGLTTVRVNTILTDDGPELFVAVIKLMSQPGLVDNFNGGAAGNMIANVDLGTGRITNCYGRLPGHEHMLAPMPRHPMTGEPIVGTEIPLWPEVVEAAKLGALAFPHLSCAAADIAVTDAGVVYVEVNHNWETSLPQLCMQAGLRKTLRPYADRIVGEDNRAALRRVISGGSG